MTTEEMAAALAGLSESQIAVMDAVCDLGDAVDGRISLADILAVMRVGIEGSPEMLAIQLAMVSKAAWMLVEERRGEANLNV